MTHYDIAIIGAGMSGLTTVCALAPNIKNGLSITLIDPADRPAGQRLESPSFDDRASALSAQTLSTFHEMGLLLDNDLTSIKSIEISDRGHAGFHKMNAESHGLQRFGGVMANRALGQHLWQHVEKRAVDWRFNTHVERSTPKKSGHELTLSDGSTFQASLVLLCDGGRSSLHQQLGLTEQTHDYQACARVATVETQSMHYGAAFERFTADGPIALLPFGHYSTLVWTGPPNHLPSDETKEDALVRLNNLFGQRLGAITRISDWTTYPLVERQLVQPHGHGFFALGNTAATLHPVAGQGFNLAIRGITRVAACIQKAQLKGKMPSYEDLNQVATCNVHDQQQTAALTQALIHSFGHRAPAIQLARGLIVNALDRHASMSKSFALASMGLLSGAPSLTNLGANQ